MKVLAISSSPRLHGNSDLLCDQFLKGAEEAGHSVEKVRLAEKSISPCAACNGCQSDAVCAKKDDMADILNDVVNADVIVLATPIYFYSMSGASPGSGKSRARISTSSSPPPRPSMRRQKKPSPDCGDSSAVCRRRGRRTSSMAAAPGIKVIFCAIPPMKRRLNWAKPYNKKERFLWNTF